MFKQLWRRFVSLNRSDYAEEGGQRVENPDALAQAGQVLTGPGSGLPVGDGMPPGYVNAYDEGRPPH